MKDLRKLMTGILCAALLSCTVSVYDVPASAEENVVFSSDFEDSELNFSGRGGNEIVTITEESAHGGKKSLHTSSRAAAWNGPQTMLEKVIEAGKNYNVSAFAKAGTAAAVTMSIQYQGADGAIHYENIDSQQNNGIEWTSFENLRLRFPADAKMMYLYFESDNADTDLYIDDIIITEAPAGADDVEDLPSLSEHFEGSFTVGTSLTPDNLESEAFMKLAGTHFGGSVTIGNQLKPDFVLDKAATLAAAEKSGKDTDPQVSLKAAAPLLDYCTENNIPLRGHTLVWHSQTPDWFFREGFSDSGNWVSKNKMQLRMENYIKNLMSALETQYPDLNIYAWDVVNEAWDEDGTPREPGSNNEKEGNSAWVQIYGDNSFIEDAFTFARKYAPAGTKLFYNDYNEYVDAKMNAILDMADDLKGKGLIDGLGLQSHLAVNYPSAAQYRTALAKYTATGLDIQITELDITTSDKSDAGLEQQAVVYRDIIDAITDYQDSISAVIFWGVTDGESWRAAQAPLLFDADFHAKPAFYSLLYGKDPAVTQAPAHEVVKITTEEADEPAPVPEGNSKSSSRLMTALIILIAVAVITVIFIVYRIKNPKKSGKKKRKY